MENENVWLNRRQLSVLFDRDVKTIGKHIANALSEELKDFPVVANFATTAADGKTYSVEHYNLDVILSVGYRVKSSRGIQFRRWANKTLKDYMMRGYAINLRVGQIEERLISHDKQLEEFGQKIDYFVKTSIPPLEGIFYGGQIFDAYVFVSDLIKSAFKRLVLIDNYVDESVLMMLSKRRDGVSAEVRHHLRRIRLPEVPARRCGQLSRRAVLPAAGASASIPRDFVRTGQNLLPV